MTRFDPLGQERNAGLLTLHVADFGPWALNLLCRNDPDLEPSTRKSPGYSSPSPPRSGGEGRGEVVLRAHGARFLQSTLNLGLFSGSLATAVQTWQISV